MEALAIPKTQFVTLAIGATAKQMGISATELHNRLKHHDLIRRLLFDCYDTLHTESIEGVVWNVQEALRNWDAKEGGARSSALAQDSTHSHDVGRTPQY